MNREILFRGKRLDNEEWVEGDICHSAQQIYIHPNHNSFRVTKAGLSKLLVMHEINPDTIVQYTGLTDKNGKKIFEGDVVKVVRSGDETWRCVVSDIRYIPSKMCGSYVKSREVIGNIHDNELLEGE